MCANNFTRWQFVDAHFVVFQNGEYGADATCCALGAANINEVRLLLPARRQFGVKATYNF